MLQIILSIFSLFVGMSIGGITGVDIFITIFGICAFFIPSIYMLSEIHKKISKDK